MLAAFYRLVLRACPPDVRDECRDMAAVAAFCIDASRQRHGALGGLWACAVAVTDALVFVVSAHHHRRTRVRRMRESGFLPPHRRPFMLLRDVRAAFHQFRHRPAFTATVVLMFAVGIGATTTIFSVVYGVLLKPLPYPEADRLVEAYGVVPSRGIDQTSFTEANVWDVRDMNRTFEAFGASHGASFTLTGDGPPERIPGLRVSAGLLRALGVKPVIGRAYQPGDDDRGAPADRVLLSDRLWQRRFGGSVDVVGRTVPLDGRPYTVIGVIPSDAIWLDADVYVPLIQRPDANRSSWEYSVAGRLKPGVSIDAARADLTRVAKILEAEHPENKGLGMGLLPSSAWLGSDSLRRTLWILLGAVGLLLIIAGVNVTNLLLVRASSRSRERAVRAALGATRADVVRECLAESLVCSAAGAVLGWAIAYGALRVLRASNVTGIPRLDGVELNGWVALFAVGVTLLVGLLTGLVPAMRLPFENVVDGLREGQRGAVGDRRQDATRAVLVAGEVALSLLLLVGAGLLVRSLTNVLNADRGFDSTNRLMATISIPRTYPSGRRTDIVTTVLDRLRAAPGVVDAAAVNIQPLSRGSVGMSIGAEDQAGKPQAAAPWADWRIVTKEYFATMGLPMVAGRGFTEQDVIGKPWRVIISERLARQLWPNGGAVGRTARLWKGQGGDAAEVIGVVRDMRERGLDGDPTLAVYLPAYGEMDATTLRVVIHTAGPPAEVTPVLRSLVASIDRTLPVSDVQTLEDAVSISTATRRFTLLLLVSFAGLALLLAIAGVYGVLAFAVARRRSEMAVRLALGARPGGLVQLTIRRGLLPVTAGLVFGLIAAWWLGQLMTSLLVGITARDPVTFAAAAAALLVPAALACYVPARRVLRVDPATALRME